PQALSADLAAQLRALEASVAVGAVPRIEPPAAAPVPVVTVILPVLNRPTLVLDAIRSVQRQTFAPWELIVVEDSSRDGRAAAVEPMLADPHIRLVRQAHGGLSAARNRALAQAKGAVIAYLDSDNLWFPDFLAAVAAAFQADPQLEC